MRLEKRCNFAMWTACKGGGVQGSSPGIILKTKNAGEAISGHFAKRLKSQIYLTYHMPICSWFRGESPHYFFLLNVFKHRIEVIMSWQIYREVLNAYVDLRTSFEI